MFGFFPFGVPTTSSFAATILTSSITASVLTNTTQFITASYALGGPTGAIGATEIGRAHV